MFVSFCEVDDSTKHIRQKIGLIIKKRRVSCSYSQREVSEMTGLTVNTISRLEASGNISLHNLLLVCQALKMQPRELFSEDISLQPPYEMLPSSKKRLELSNKLHKLVMDDSFFSNPKRVSEVIRELKEDPKISNKLSVLLTQYCKQGHLGFVMKGAIKKYHKINNNNID